MKTLRLILGDQLNHHHSWYNQVSEDTTYLMMEIGQELTYTTHHIQKVVAFFLAMRKFSDHLKEQGHQVTYLKLDDPGNTQNLEKNIRLLIEKEGFEKFEFQLPDEWRLDEQLTKLAVQLPVEAESFSTEHFLTSRDELSRFFEGKKQLLMESFYRMMRQKHDVLMEHGDPVGGQWNFDHDNRKKMPKGTFVPAPMTFDKGVSEIISLLDSKGVKTIGRIDPDHFIWPVTREESLELLAFFIDKCLPWFGAYQDAMTTEGWSLFHSRISFALNAKLLSPLEVIQRVASKWRADPDYAPLSAVEGFIRQILGWREYMRGIYWKYMPAYAQKNFFGHERKLPSWFWNGKTRMKCLAHSIGQSLDHAYAHHIQRLMVTGNFALLAGIDPDEVDQWYLGIYIDAIEWVEITNTRGMSQFADGGIVATKPYVASANYMHKMGHYCSGCAYDHKKKTGQDACPLNSLYWDFIERNRNKLSKNPRMSMMYRLWDKNSPENQNLVLEQAAYYMNHLEEL